MPARVRRVLNVESGLNDGIATPFVGIFLAGAAASESVHGANGVASAAVDLLGGAGMGIAIGVGGALLLRAAVARNLSAPAFRALAPLALALLAYAGTVQVGANGFVAAFVAGMAFGSLLPPDLEPTIAFTDVTGEVLSLLVWFIVGSAMLVPAFQHAQWQDVVFAVLALTVIRMVPVAIACVGLQLDRRTVVFIGWFGPRGLASVIFALARGGHPRRARCQQGARRRHPHRRAERARSRHHRIAVRRPVRRRGIEPSPRSTRAPTHTRATAQIAVRQQKTPRQCGAMVTEEANGGGRQDRWRVVPILGWIRSYDRRWLRGDLIAGFAVAALIVPKNLGYAGIAGIPAAERPLRRGRRRDPLPDLRHQPADLDRAELGVGRGRRQRGRRRRHHRDRGRRRPSSRSSPSSRARCTSCSRCSGWGGSRSSCRGPWSRASCSARRSTS